MFDSVNHTCFPKEEHLPDCAGWDNQGKRSDRVEEQQYTHHIDCAVINVILFFNWSCAEHFGSIFRQGQ
jgi:hypothetical protein